MEKEKEKIQKRKNIYIFEELYYNFIKKIVVYK
jgi:hypothetical protein